MIRMILVIAYRVFVIRMIRTTSDIFNMGVIRMIRVTSDGLCVICMILVIADTTCYYRLHVTTDVTMLLQTLHMF